jgi:hypothetical protein
MCTGGAQFVDFMIANTRTFRGRIQEVANIDKAVRELARSRVAKAVAIAKRIAETPPAPPPSDGSTAETAPADASASPDTPAITPPTSNDPATAAADRTATDPTGTAPAPAAAPVPPPPLKPDIEAVPTDYAGMIAEVVKALPDSASGIVADDGTPLDWLGKLQSWLRQDGDNLEAEKREAVVLALRATEAGIYAELMQGRYEGINEALFGSINKLRDLHKARCTCDAN